MDFYEAMFKRKSIRKYDLNSLDENTLKNVSDYMSTIVHMKDDIKVEMKIVSQEAVNNLLSIKAPHYIVMFSENKDGYLTNAGFMLQQMDLYLSANGIGSCWVGMVKPSKALQDSSDLEFVIVMAFGKPKEQLYRETISEFKRKSIKEICNSNDFNEILETARIAPSATNSQPWYFTIKDNLIHSYCIKPNIIKAIMYERINKIDMGITLCHIWIASKHFNKTTEFLLDNTAKNNPPSGYYYINTIKL